MRSKKLRHAAGVQVDNLAAPGMPGPRFDGRLLVSENHDKARANLENRLKDRRFAIVRPDEAEAMDALLAYRANSHRPPDLPSSVNFICEDLGLNEIRSLIELPDLTDELES